MPNRVFGPKSTSAYTAYTAYTAYSAFTACTAFTVYNVYTALTAYTNYIAKNAYYLPWTSKFASAEISHPSVLEIALGLRPQAILGLGMQNLCWGKFRGSREVVGIFPCLLASPNLLILGGQNTPPLGMQCIVTLPCPVGSKWPLFTSCGSRWFGWSCLKNSNFSPAFNHFEEQGKGSQAWSRNLYDTVWGRHQSFLHRRRHSRGQVAGKLAVFWRKNETHHCLPFSN